MTLAGISRCKQFLRPVSHGQPPDESLSYYVIQELTSKLSEQDEGALVSMPFTHKLHHSACCKWVRMVSNLHSSLGLNHLLIQNFLAFDNTNWILEVALSYSFTMELASYILCENISIASFIDSLIVKVEGNIQSSDFLHGKR